MTQEQIDVDELADDMETEFSRVPNLFILDTSSSMSGNRIDKLNQGLDLFVEEVVGDKEAEWSIDVSIVTFGGNVEIEQDFKPIDKAWIDSNGKPDTPNLKASGTTPMAEAIVEGIEHLEEYKDAVDKTGTGRKRALVWLLTDGEPDMDQSPGTDDWNTAQDLIEHGTMETENENPHMFFFSAAVSEDANKDTLDELVSVGNEDLVHSFNLKENMFKELFEVASDSAKDSATGEKGQTKEDVLSDEALEDEESE